MVTVLLTRPEQPSRDLARDLRTRAPDLEILVAPALTIARIDANLSDWNVDALVLTSQHAVEAARRVGDLPVYCVGDATARAAREAGLRAVSANGDADRLADALLQTAHQAFGHLHGRHVRGDIEARLVEAGRVVRSAVVYEQHENDCPPKERAALNAAKSVIVPLFSPRTAKIVGHWFEGCACRITIVGMSDAVIDAWTGPKPTETVIAENPRLDAMISAILGAVTRSPLEGGGQTN